MKYLLMGLVLLSATAGFCENPQEAAAAILKLVETRDYATLFPERYTEWHKVAAEGVAPEDAVKKLSAMFDKKHDTIMQVYKQLTEAEFEFSKNEYPQITETGETAIAEINIGSDKMPVTLYKMKSGLRGFHL